MPWCCCNDEEDASLWWLLVCNNLTTRMKKIFPSTPWQKSLTRKKCSFLSGPWPISVCRFKRGDHIPAVIPLCNQGTWFFSASNHIHEVTYTQFFFSSWHYVDANVYICKKLKKLKNTIKTHKMQNISWKQICPLLICLSSICTSSWPINPKWALQWASNEQLESGHTRSPWLGSVILKVFST